VSDFIDAKDGKTHNCRDADAKQHLGGCSHLIVGADGFGLICIELLAGELANMIYEDGDGLVEALVTRFLSACGLNVGGRGPEQGVGLRVENAQDELRVVNEDYRPLELWNESRR
jgi:hypothetical protein